MGNLGTAQIGCKMKAFLRAKRSLATSVLLALSIFAFLPLTSSAAHAEETPAPLAASKGAGEKSGGESGEAEEHNGPRKPTKFVEEHHEGIETVQVALVGGAIVIAIGLAYRAGKRRR